MPALRHRSYALPDVVHGADLEHEVMHPLRHRRGGERHGVVPRIRVEERDEQREPGRQLDLDAIGEPHAEQLAVEPFGRLRIHGGEDHVAEALVAGDESGRDERGPEGLRRPLGPVEQLDRHAVRILDAEDALHAARARDVVARVRRREPRLVQRFRQAAQRRLVVHLEPGVREIVARPRMDDDALRLVVDAKGDAAVRSSLGHEQAQRIDHESLPGRDVADLEAEVSEP